jgi:Mn-dependent DtxR family transcriptional regulator
MKLTPLMSRVYEILRHAPMVTADISRVLEINARKTLRKMEKCGIIESSLVIEIHRNSKGEEYGRTTHRMWSTV